MTALGCAFLSLLLVAFSGQSTSWFPPELEVMFARQLTSRLATINSPPAYEEGGISSAARGSIRMLARILGSWTDVEVVGRAPLFPDITLPTANQRHIDAMARYQVCSLVLLGQFESGKDAETRRKGALGATAMTIAVERLRAPYMATGGTDKVLDAFLASPPMISALDGIRKRPEHVGHVERQCAPLIQELLLKPL
jgi:hypothetical protein